jgi:hypothetical protein
VDRLIGSARPSTSRHQSTTQRRRSPPRSDVTRPRRQSLWRGDAELPRRRQPVTGPGEPHVCRWSAQVPERNSAAVQVDSRPRRRPALCRLDPLLTSVARNQSLPPAAGHPVRMRRWMLSLLGCGEDVACPYRGRDLHASRFMRAPRDAALTSPRRRWRSPRPGRSGQPTASRLAVAGHDVVDDCLHSP